MVLVEAIAFDRSRSSGRPRSDPARACRAGGRQSSVADCVLASYAPVRSRVLEREDDWLQYRMFDWNATAREEKVEASGRDLGTLGQMEEWGPSPVARDARYVIRALTTSIGQF